MAITFTRSTGSGGVGGAADAYPGSLTPFQSTNTDTTNTAGRGLKLVVGTITLLQDNNEFDIGGDADTVHAIVVGSAGVAAKAASVDDGLGTGTITFAAEGTFAAGTKAGFMAIVS
jgi:hypothetical protein